MIFNSLRINNYRAYYGESIHNITCARKYHYFVDFCL